MIGRWLWRLVAWLLGPGVSPRLEDLDGLSAVFEEEAARLRGPP